MHLNMNVSTLPDSSIPDTPQSLLDAAAFYFSNECGPMASGLLERCELLALENFCISNGFSPNCDTAQMDVIDFLRHKLPKEYELGFFGCWAGRRQVLCLNELEALFLNLINDLCLLGLTDTMVTNGTPQSHASMTLNQPNASVMRYLTYIKPSTSSSKNSRNTRQRERET